MASLVVMNKPLITRMVNDLVTKRRIPSFRSSWTAPTRLSESDKAGKQRWNPDRIRTGSRQKTRVAPAQFRQYRLSEGSPLRRNAIHPKRKSPRLEQIGSSVAKASRFHATQCLDGAGFLGPGMGQAPGRENLRRPFLERRPSCRRSVAPIGFRAFPRGPGLFGAKILVRVVHQRIKPALRSCFREKVSGDPLLQRSTKRKMVLSFSAMALQKTRATGVQCGPDDFWKLISSFRDGANPQKEHVPFGESRRALCQLMPRNKEGLLQGSLLAVAPNVENEVCGVFFRHPRPVSGGGRWETWSELFHCTSSGATADERNRRAAVGGRTRRLTI